MAYLLSNTAVLTLRPNKKAPAAARAMTIPLFNCGSSLQKVFVYDKSQHMLADILYKYCNFQK